MPSDIAGMKDKVRENRLRQIAARLDLEVVKSRRRDPRAIDFDRYMIRDPYANCVVAGVGPTGSSHFTLDDVEHYLCR